MRAAVMRRKKLVVDDIPTPEPGPGEVLVKTLACGICGSDLHALKHAEKLVDVAKRTSGAFIMDPDRDVVMGHEFSAEILDYGPGAMKALKTGTRVCSMPVVFGGPNGISTVGYSNENPGGYAEFMRLSEMLLLEIPNGLSSEHAALTEPMAVGLHAVEKARLEKNDVPLVVGCGPVGLAVIAALKIRGAAPIVAADFSRRRRELAIAMGADVVVDPAERSPYQRWAEVAPWPNPEDAPMQPPWMPGPPLRPQVVFECVGVPGVISQILCSAHPQARIVVVGVCMEKDSFEPMFGINKELNVQFVLAYTPAEFAETLGHIAEGRVNVSPLVTGKVGVGGVAGAFEELASPERHAKILVEPWRS